MKLAQSAYDVEFDLGLPFESAQFLAISNGGMCGHDQRIRLSNGIDVVCDCLFLFE